MVEEMLGLGAVTVLGVLEQAYFSIQVIYARRKYSVSPPATTGPPEFERVFRAQANCSEYFPIFITVLWTSGVFFSQGLTSVCGLMYLFGRFRYFQGYSASAQGRNGNRTCLDADFPAIFGSMYRCPPLTTRLAPLYFSAQVLWLLIGFSCVGIFLSFCQLYLNVDLLQQLASVLDLV